MANYTWSAVPRIESDATFRAWGKSISDALAVVGLVKSGDVGQVDWSTATLPAGNVETNYEVWRLDDSIQISNPVYFRITYSRVSSYFGAKMLITIGTSTDGAGNVNQDILSKTVFCAANSNPPYSNFYCQISSDGSGVALALCLNTSDIYLRSLIQVERTRNSIGEANSRGLLVGIRGNNTGSGSVFRFSDSNKQVLSNALPYVPGNPTPGHSFLGPDNNIVTYPGYGAFPELQYSKMTLGYSYADLGYGSTQTINHLGADRTYLALGNYITGWSNTGLAAVSPLIWWEDL